jgi:hypothetical protein
VQNSQQEGQAGKPQVESEGWANAKVKIKALDPHYPFRNLSAKYGGGVSKERVWIKVETVE